MKVKTAVVLSTGVAQAVTSLDICEASYQGIYERVLACPGGRIRITGATYGRPSDDRETCCANPRKCWVKAGTTCTSDATEWVTKKCEDESECTLFGNMNGVLGDPCPKRHKFLDVQYECDYSTPVKTASFCEAQLENRTNEIQCSGEGEVITIKAAKWGRTKDAYCCPHKQDSNCLASSCSASTNSVDVMGDLCNGQSNCSWDYSVTDKLKDPCSEVFKYMHVDYECAVPAPPPTTTSKLSADAPGRIEFTHPISGLALSHEYNTNTTCLDIMTKATEYYIALLDNGLETNELHGQKFQSVKGKKWNETFGVGRRAMFNRNMQRVGNKLTNEGCNCPHDLYLQVDSSIQIIPTLGNRVARDLLSTNQALRNMIMGCKSRYHDLVNRKVDHAEQILFRNNRRNHAAQFF